jgi:phytoene synthase
MPASPEDYAYCEMLVRRDDPDRWLAGLFIPSSVRKNVFALYAFNLEIARVREITSEPMLGEIRFQWWYEAIEATGNSDLSANPVAAALLDTIARFDLPKSELLDLIEARGFDLYDEPVPTVLALENYCKATSSTLFRLIMAILHRETGIDTNLAHSGGIAYALTGILRGLPWTLARGQIFLPLESLSRHGVEPEELLAGATNPGIMSALAELRRLARSHLANFNTEIGGASDTLKQALLPVSLCASYLKQMEKASYDPFKSIITLPQWRRQWRLWRAAKFFG